MNPSAHIDAPSDGQPDALVPPLLLCSWEQAPGHKPLHARRHALQRTTCRAGPPDCCICNLLLETCASLTMVCEGTLAAARPLPQFRPTLAKNKNPLSNGQDLHFPCHIRVRFPTRNPEEHVQVDAMVDSGNCVPGSAVNSESFLNAMGVQDLLIPTSTHIMTANEEGQPLQVIGKLCHLHGSYPHPNPASAPHHGGVELVTPPEPGGLLPARIRN